MLRLLIHLSDLTGLPLAITPAERWSSARPTDFGSGSFSSMYVIVPSLLGAVAVILLALLVRRWLVGRHARRVEFREQAERAGLGKEETNLLTYAARLGELRTPVNIIVTEAVFQKCMHLLMRCQRVAEMSPADKKKILSVINSAQIKLSFDESATSDIRQIPDGAVITLTGEGLGEPMQASIVSAQGWEIKAQANGQAPNPVSGIQLRGRYFRSGAVWEFETELIYAEGRDLTLAHAENIRFINRRRFRRVSVDRPASLAPFPFLRAKPQEPPVFYPARLMELGATGLLLEAEDVPSIPDNSRLLMLLEPRPGRSINAVGIVQRTETITSRKSQMVIELMDLSEAEVSELVAETNLIAQQDTTAKPAAAEPAAAEPAAYPVWRT